MRSLTAQDVLEIWERSQGGSATARALSLFSAACPEMTREELLAVPVGQRDRHLIELRERTFGSTLNCVVECPSCDQTLEFALDTGDLRDGAEGRDASSELALTLDSLVLRLRLPNSADLLTVEGCDSVAQARRLLLQRCLLEARRKGDAIAASKLSDDEIGAISEGMADAEPQGELLVDLQCPLCAHRWRELVDIGTYFWAELAAEASRLLEEIHALARAYGWREADILAMSARRRRTYLERLGA